MTPTNSTAPTGAASSVHRLGRAHPPEAEPLCGEEEFAEIMRDMVALDTPRLSAVVQEYGERVDAEIAAWGMAFEDNAEVVTTDGRLWMSMASAEDALIGFRWGTNIRAHLIWPAEQDVQAGES